MRYSLHNPVAEYRQFQEAMGAAVAGVLASGRYTHGPAVAEFEERFAAFLGARHAIACQSGTAAIFLGLLGAGIGPGDEVITAPNSDVPTTAAITHTGARVVLADIEAHTFNLDPDQVESRITRRTRAILAVHMYGLPAPTAPLRDIARRRGLVLLEDAALAAGASHQGVPVGKLGDVACFSVSPGKVLAGLTQGGVVVTDNNAFAARARLFRGYGEEPGASRRLGDVRLDPWRAEVEGYNLRMESLTAAGLLVKLPRLGELVARRRAVAALYGRLLAGSAAVTPAEPAGFYHAYRNYAVRVPQRDRVREYLHQRGIGTGILYIPPVHLQPAYGYLGLGRGAMPVAERVADELLCLPMYPQLADAEVEEIALTLRDALSRVA